MSSRRPIPDIMGSLMNGNSVTVEQPFVEHEQENKPAIKQSNLKETEQPSNPLRIKQESNQAIKLIKNKGVEQDSNKGSSDELKEKATFNLPLSTLEDLEDTWIRLRRKLKRGQRVTKTLIVEKALEIALDDLTKNGDKSELYKRLINS